MRGKILLAMLLVSALFGAAMAGVGVVSASPTNVYIDPPVIWDTNMGECSTFTVQIRVDYVVKLWGYQIELFYNPAVLECVGYANGPFLGSAGGNVMWLPGQGPDNEAGKLWLFGAALYPKLKFPTGGGVLATVTFHVVGIGESPITFSEDTGLADMYGRWIFHGPGTPGYFANMAGPELYIRKRGAHGTSGLWFEWQVGPFCIDQIAYCRVMSYGRTMGAWVKVEVYVKTPAGTEGPYTTNEAWVDPATLVGQEWIPDEAVVSVTFKPQQIGKYYAYGVLYFKAGGMTIYWPFEETSLEGEGVSRDINVAFKVTD